MFTKIEHIRLSEYWIAPWRLGAVVIRPGKRGFGFESRQSLRQVFREVSVALFMT
jgi:hypothetical protein